MLNLNAFGSMQSTSKPKHTMADKGSMKALQRFTQMEKKEHDHGEDFFPFFRCKQHGCMQGTKHAVDLI